MTTGVMILTNKSLCSLVLNVLISHVTRNYGHVPRVLLGFNITTKCK